MAHHPLLLAKARHVIRHSHLSDEEKQTMYERLPFLDSGMLTLFVLSADENPFALDAIARSLKKKLETRGNLQNLHEVLVDEDKAIRELDLLDLAEPEGETVTNTEGI